jgi:hypothetical protein
MVEVGSAETLPLGIDFAAYLEGAETVNGSGGPTATLVDLASISITPAIGPASLPAVRHSTLSGLPGESSPWDRLGWRAVRGVFAVKMQDLAS